MYIGQRLIGQLVLRSKVHYHNDITAFHSSSIISEANWLLNISESFCCCGYHLHCYSGTYQIFSNGHLRRNNTHTARQFHGHILRHTSHLLRLPVPRQCRPNLHVPEEQEPKRVLQVDHCFSYSHLYYLPDNCHLWLSDLWCSYQWWFVEVLRLVWSSSAYNGYNVLIKDLYVLSIEFVLCQVIFKSNESLFNLLILIILIFYLELLSKVFG